MSESNGNGAPDANALRNAFRVLHGEVRRMEKVARRSRKAGLMRGPRQFCAVCGKTFDMAIVDPNAVMTKSICSECKQLLAQGYTACITSNEFAFIRSDYLKEHGLAGKIVPMTDDAFKQLQTKFNVSRESDSQT